MQQLQIPVDDGTPRGYQLAVRRDDGDHDGTRYLVYVDEWPVAVAWDRPGEVALEVVDERRCASRGLDLPRLTEIADLAVRAFDGVWALAVDDADMIDDVRSRPWPGESRARKQPFGRLLTRSFRA
jgi:hypothetical protein